MGGGGSCRGRSQMSDLETLSAEIKKCLLRKIGANFCVLLKHKIELSDAVLSYEVLKVERKIR